MPEQETSASRRAGRIRDARGRRVTQLDPIALWLTRRHDIIAADVLRTVAHADGVRIAGRERAAFVVGIVGALLIVGLFTHGLISGDIRDATLAKSSSLIFASCVPWIVWYVSKRARFHNVAAALLKHLRCPHCGYDIRGLPTDPTDGATVCPECGCAWKPMGLSIGDCRE
ncbi:MAG TPA: hypothetical protein PKK06_02020 [Phycisphaerae bacterium]|nr:hypothetical protein [Phycisphaerae bacterium]HNU44098.1 hypothetical protein [Phycisphaerae bacterium]